MRASRSSRSAPRSSPGLGWRKPCPASPSRCAGTRQRKISNFHTACSVGTGCCQHSKHTRFSATMLFTTLFSWNRQKRNVNICFFDKKSSWKLASVGNLPALQLPSATATRQVVVLHVACRVQSWITTVRAVGSNILLRQDAPARTPAHIPLWTTRDDLLAAHAGGKT
jgi:hypothetical protein